ncbi:MmcQ/YjbR family DNA-binding protein [Naasia sp. SYSU D00948]|uniref:MmcQ/YjbR family DNA-binding protein n=1 Tax=Naasia sp. SYSU D00948 TaxID=2817379 RepID=UPI001B30D308|nr:MmcQ/YjbR family DNA-binding protein [Naasia sp. SYSU D00948]
MDGRSLHAISQNVAEQLPAAVLTHPFGTEWEVFKVKDRVFMLLTEVTGEPIVILKADPEDGQALRHTYPQITPGYHMNKKHWITVRAGGAVSEDLVHELVINSYRLVVAGLPRREQPVDPISYGRRP